MIEGGKKMTNPKVVCFCKLYCAEYFSNNGIAGRYVIWKYKKKFYFCISYLKWCRIKNIEVEVRCETVLFLYYSKISLNMIVPPPEKTDYIY